MKNDAEVMAKQPNVVDTQQDGREQSARRRSGPAGQGKRHPNVRHRNNDRKQPHAADP